MAINFDGDNLIITLDSGVTEVDVREDLYEGWKDWLLANTQNLKYPRAFRPIGGDELSSVINAGAYFFLNNKDGWRIKPPEENITILLTGNLALESVSTEAVIPTVGTFTTAIFGIQPITQGVTPVMADQLAFSSFQGEVNLNVMNGSAGIGSIGSDEIGTKKAPSGNSADTLLIAQREGLTTIRVGANMTLNSNTDWSRGYVFIGERPQIQVTFDPLPNLTNCAMTNMTLFGELDGVNTLRDCSVGTISNASGFVDKCAFFGDVTLNGDMSIFQSYSQKAGENFVIFNTGNHEFQVSDWRRSMGITNMTGGIHTIEMYGGQLHLDNTCIGGTIFLRGNYSSPPDDQSNGTELVDQTGSRILNEMYGQITRFIHIDTELLINGNGDQQTPYNNFTDAVDFMEANGLRHMIILSDATVDRQLKNFTILGVGVPAIDLNGQIMDNTILERCAVTGSYTGEIQATECAVFNLSNIAGVFLTCTMAGTMTVAAGQNLLISRVAPAIAAQPWILSMNSGVPSVAAIHNSSGGVIITNMDHAGDILHFNGSQGEIVFGATNTLGNAVVTGGAAVDDALNGGTVIDKTRINAELYLDAIT